MDMVSGGGGGEDDDDDDDNEDDIRKGRPSRGQLSFPSQSF